MIKNTPIKSHPEVAYTEDKTINKSYKKDTYLKAPPDRHLNGHLQVGSNRHQMVRVKISSELPIVCQDPPRLTKATITLTKLIHD